MELNVRDDVLVADKYCTAADDHNCAGSTELFPEAACRTCVVGLDRTGQVRLYVL